MDNNIEKRIQSLRDRLSYLVDIFAGKHKDNADLLEEKLTAFTARVRSGNVEDPYAELATVEDLFNYVERRLEGSITPMDKVRIVRHSQRICLRDILENVYDNFTEVGGQDEHSLDPSMLIARAVITRRRGKKVYTQSVMVIGQEKGHGAEFRNGGSVKPWGNAKAQQYMRVAETEGIPVHTYIFTPGSYPIEDYPGAAQQIARNIYCMAGLRVPVIAVISEGGSGGAEAIGLADKRLMLSHQDRPRHLSGGGALRRFRLARPDCRESRRSGERNPCEGYGAEFPQRNQYVRHHGGRQFLHLQREVRRRTAVAQRGDVRLHP